MSYGTLYKQFKMFTNNHHDHRDFRRHYILLMMRSYLQEVSLACLYLHHIPSFRDEYQYLHDLCQCQSSEGVATQLLIYCLVIPFVINGDSDRRDCKGRKRQYLNIFSSSREDYTRPGGTWPGTGC